MNYDEWKLLLLTVVPTGGVFTRWLLLRRQSPTVTPTFGPLRFARWLMQIATANVRLAQLEQVERSTRATLATTANDFTACRTENDRLRLMIARLQGETEQQSSGAASSTPRTSSAGVKRLTKRSRRATPKSGASPRPRRSETP